MSSNLKRRASDGGPDKDDPPKKIKEKCEPECKLVSLTVIQNATQTNVTGAKNWACVKKATDDVIVQATTDPDNEACWSKINWSGDAGVEVPGHPNQRKLSRKNSKKYHVQAELGGVSDYVDVWVLWATVTILTSGTNPTNSRQFGGIEDGTENLGAVTWDGGKKGAGKVCPVAEITPKGVHDIVKSGWDFKRERMSHDWKDGVKDTAANYWNTTWQDDTSAASWKKLTPDSDDKIYDLDGPTIGLAPVTNDAETYNNFRQWIEWSGERCADNAEWYYQARRDKSKNPQVTLNDVDTGNIKLPDKSHFHP